MAYSSFKGTSKSKATNFSRRSFRRKRLQIIGKVVTVFFIIFIALILLGFVAFGVFAVSLPSPDKLTNRDVDQSTKIFDRNGELLYDVYGDENRTLVKLDEIPESLKEATIA